MKRGISPIKNKKNISSSASNTRQKANEILSNSNLYKNDNRYNQNIQLEFENKHENDDYFNCITAKRWKMYVVFSYLGFFVISFFTSFESKPKCSNYMTDFTEGLDVNGLFSLENENETYQYDYFLILITLTSVALMWIDSPIFSLHNRLIVGFNLCIMGVIHIYQVYYVNCSFYTQQVGNYCKEGETCSISFYKIITIREYIQMFFKIILGNLVVKNSFMMNILFIFINGLVLFSLSVLENNSSIIIIRVLYNLFSFNIFKYVISLGISLLIQFFLYKSQTELWVLYDSFKRSYNVAKSEFDLKSNPIFIVSKKNYGILYNNLSAKKLISKNLESKQKTANPNEKKMTRRILKEKDNKLMNFKEIFYSTEQYEQFNNEIEALDLEKSPPMFRFKFYIRDEKNSFIPTNEEEKKEDEKKGPLVLNSILKKKTSSTSVVDKAKRGYNNENYVWYNILILPTVIKSQESHFIQFIPDDYVEEMEFMGEQYRDLCESIQNIIDEISIPISMAYDVQKNLQETEQFKNFKPGMLANISPGSPEINKLSKIKSFNPLQAQQGSVRIGSGRLKSNLSYEIRKSLPKTSYAFGYYLMYLSKISFNKAKTLELLESNCTFNNCSSKFCSLTSSGSLTDTYYEENNQKGIRRTHSTIQDKDISLNIGSGVKNPPTNSFYVEKTDNKEKEERKGNINNTVIANTSMPNFITNNLNAKLVNCVEIKPKLFFESVLNSFNLLYKRRNYSSSLQVIVNENICINEDLYNVVLRNIILFCFNSLSEDKVKEILNFENVFKMKVVKEKNNLLSFTLKFNCSADDFEKFNLFNTLLEKYYKIKAEENLLNVSQGETHHHLNQAENFHLNDQQLIYLDKFRVLDPGFMLAAHLVNIYSKRRIVINRDGIKRRKSNLVSCSNLATSNLSRISSTNVLNTSSNFEIDFKFYLPYEISPNSEQSKVVPELDVIQFKHCNQYWNIILKKLYKQDIEEVKKVKSNISGKNQIYDTLPDICKLINYFSYFI